jgi:hypothetical protein
MDTKGEGGGTDWAGMLDNGLPVRSEREGLGRQLVVPVVNAGADADAAARVRFGGGADRPGAASPLLRLLVVVVAARAPLFVGRFCRVESSELESFKTSSSKSDAVLAKRER